MMISSTLRRSSRIASKRNFDDLCETEDAENPSTSIVNTANKKKCRLSENGNISSRTSGIDTIVPQKRGRPTTKKIEKIADGPPQTVTATVCPTIQNLSIPVVRRSNRIPIKRTFYEMGVTDKYTSTSETSTVNKKRRIPENRDRPNMTSGIETLKKEITLEPDEEISVERHTEMQSEVIPETENENHNGIMSPSLVIKLEPISDDEFLSFNNDTLHWNPVPVANCSESVLDNCNGSNFAEIREPPAAIQIKMELPAQEPDQWYIAVPVPDPDPFDLNDTTSQTNCAPEDFHGYSSDREGIDDDRWVEIKRETNSSPERFDISFEPQLDLETDQMERAREFVLDVHNGANIAEMREPPAAIEIKTEPTEQELDLWFIAVPVPDSDPFDRNDTSQMNCD